jgi:hypothetical protein
MRTNEFFLQQAKISTETTENLTIEMADIAVKTRHETNSMHIITIFTLIFLPGTFVAVRHCVTHLEDSSQLVLTACQTFFSSGIIDFDGYDGNLSMANMIGFSTKWAALKLFGAICIPLMAATLSVWAFAYFLAWRQHNKNLKLNKSMDSNDPENGISQPQHDGSVITK